MNYKIIPETPNFRTVTPVSNKTSISPISSEVLEKIVNTFNKLKDRINEALDRNSFLQNLSSARREAIIRVRKLPNAGFALISIITIAGILIFTAIAFVIIKNILY